MRTYCFRKILSVVLIALCSTSISALQPLKGYRGFVDSDNFLGINPGFLTGDGGPSTIYTGFTTSHGYQFNPWLYVGGGAGFVYNLSWKTHGYHYDDAQYIIPVFAEARFDAKWRRFTPYFSIQLGANVNDHGGIYCTPVIGYRFNWGRKSAVNLGFGATIFGRRMSYYEHVPHPDGGITEGPLVHYQGTFAKFTVRLGFEFQLP